MYRVFVKDGLLTLKDLDYFAVDTHKIKPVLVFHSYDL